MEKNLTLSEPNKLELAAEIRKKASELIGHDAEIVPNGTAFWVKGWVKTTQVDLRPKTPCVLVVVEGEDKKIYRRCFGSPLLKVDLESKKREAPTRTHIPTSEPEILEALRKAQVALEAAKTKVELLNKALEEAKALEAKTSKKSK